MGSDAKSPQHTAVHPMYVSYSSLPTTNSATTTHKLILNQSKTNLLNTSSNNIKYDVFKVNNTSNGNTIIDTNTILSSSSTSSAKKLVVDHTNTPPSKIHHSQSQHCYPPTQQQVPQQNCPQHHPLSRHSSFNNKQNRKNSNLSVRYTDMVQVVPRSCPSPPPPPIPPHPRQIIDEEFQTVTNDECYFIPKSTSTQKSNQNFGIQNPFHRQIMDRRFIVAEEETDDNTSDNMADNDDDNSLIALNPQPLGSTTPLKKVNSPSSRQHYHRNPHHQPAYRNRAAMDAANKLLQIPTPPQHLIEEEISFKMPYQHVLTRSPNLNRISRRSNMSSSSSNSNFLLKSQHGNFCDQVRDAPPGYMDPPPPPSLQFMHRAKSQDRLAQRSSRRQNGGDGGNGANGGGRFNQSDQQRPRSFCSNVFPDFVQE